MPANSPDIRKALLTLVGALLLVSAVLVLLWHHLPDLSAPPPADTLAALPPERVITLSAAADMSRALDAATVYWPPRPGHLPAVVVAGLPDDMASLDAGERSALLLRIALVPAVLANYRIRQERRYLQTATRFGPPQTGNTDHARLVGLARRYGVNTDLHEAGTLERLHRRIAEVPVSLVLATAALESGWGMSRFAVSSHALFGQWSGRVGQQPRRFEHPDASVSHFMHTLNTHPAFAEWRQARQQRESLAVLSDRLAPWSPAHADFSRELLQIIETHGLDQLPELRPANSPQ